MLTTRNASGSACLSCVLAQACRAGADDSSRGLGAAMCADHRSITSALDRDSTAGREKARAVAYEPAGTALRLIGIAIARHRPPCMPAASCMPSGPAKPRCETHKAGYSIVRCAPSRRADPPNRETVER